VSRKIKVEAIKSVKYKLNKDDKKEWYYPGEIFEVDRKVLKRLEDKEAVRRVIDIEPEKEEKEEDKK